uniref:Very-long-chain 3-oxoacyl-CoA reductase n=1 Tax=Eucampia antarctica TaxID=49252 RepID=A0A7S2R322_9STRA|mmetsp:Transcript_13676/g.13240  ORF Transcript_13676/g.13240 Transcript_13676/m.13240 type:complete len:331 (+) Transcript_13676:73-1065(+)|eukprot:CAMPEP_0197833926 /NCGR_PEP_ID=MMETSP1437-20131217/20576_1 /TAXON_ID=49252 ORGANISM="Eucampia antarctica, Strain CCMP1452" /NCGR_SAMPLE_ID=MMETSP1437 /ASSEMBLY_ACC=CAM_ASM_001096 /LENGTH=330 /DNA_ID=CAMNT_0043438259 /DNA_START=43 /DNA_END=1035 /DNA_ORIENTATION=+
MNLADYLNGDTLGSFAALSVSFLIVNLGAYSLISGFLKIVKGMYKTFLRPGKNLKKLGKWAVVTGATDGIGKAYAMALAKKGLNVVLISRTETKLQDVKKEIEDKDYGVEVKYVVCDYSNFDKKAQDHVASEIQDLDIGVLVNNVGISYRYPLYFHELTDEDVTNIVEMNVNSTTWMTRLVIDKMAERKRGSIINISSGSAMYPLPLLAQYSAAKSYIEKFTLALNAEYSKQGVSVQCQIPFYVSTKLAKMRRSLSVPSPAEFVSCAIKHVGHADPVVSPYWVHGLMSYFMDRLPTSWVTSIIMSMHVSTRKRGLKKETKLKEESEKKGN